MMIIIIKEAGLKNHNMRELHGRAKNLQGNIVVFGFLLCKIW